MSLVTMTGDEICTMVAEKLAGFWAQVSVHGSHKGSVQVFHVGTNRLVADFDLPTVAWGNGPFQVDRVSFIPAIRDQIEANTPTVPAFGQMFTD